MISQKQMKQKRKQPKKKRRMRNHKKKHQKNRKLKKKLPKSRRPKSQKLKNRKRKQHQPMQNLQELTSKAVSFTVSSAAIAEEIRKFPLNPRVTGQFTVGTATCKRRTHSLVRKSIA